MVMFSYTGIYKTKSSSYAYTSGNHTPSRATGRANSLFTVMPHAIYSNLIDTYGYFCGLQLCPHICDIKYYTTNSRSKQSRDQQKTNCPHLHPSDRKKPPTDDGTSFIEDLQRCSCNCTQCSPAETSQMLSTLL